MTLFIYGTVFNNASRVQACIDSLMPLKYTKIFVVDNYSTDGTYEILKSFGNIVKIKQRKCSHGLGRQIALEMALKEVNQNDFLMYVDFDIAYKKKFIKRIKYYIKKLKYDEVSLLSMLSRAKINKLVPWRDLMNAQDLERHAHFKALGFKLVATEEEFNILYGGKGIKNSYYNDDPTIGQNIIKRNMRYKKSEIQFFIRMLKVLIDDERGSACISFSEFYSKSSKKNIFNLLIFILTYVIARLKGVYSYSDKKDNLNYIKEDLF